MLLGHSITEQQTTNNKFPLNVCRPVDRRLALERFLKTNRAQQVGQAERRITRFLFSSRFGRRRLTLDVGRLRPERLPEDSLRSRANAFAMKGTTE